MTADNHGRRWIRVPPDMLALLGIYFVLLPTMMIASAITSSLLNLRRYGDTTLLWTAIGIGAVGTVLLLFAKLPLYREKRFFEIGPRRLDPVHKGLYKWAWFLIVISLGLLGAIIAALR